jgi:hypothetical protein
MTEDAHQCKEKGPWHVDISAFGYWYAFDANRDGVRYIRFCPWCGAKLDDNMEYVEDKQE